ncbi:hypothetical protein Dimus_009519 [Dionaea muscipula]
MRTSPCKLKLPNHDVIWLHHIFNLYILASYPPWFHGVIHQWTNLPGATIQVLLFNCFHGDWKSKLEVEENFALLILQIDMDLTGSDMLCEDVAINSADCSYNFSLGPWLSSITASST